jgi:hypothetical protein
MISHRRLSGDDRGAITLLALFFSIFALALLYSLISAAEASFFREHMQDAADAVALSSAVMHARSMNCIVLVNILMAALLAVLVSIKLIQGLTIIGMVVAGALSWLTFGASLAAVPPLHVLQTEMQNLYDATKVPVFEALEILHQVADELAVAGPIAAGAAATADIEFWRPPVESGVVVPSIPELPVEDDSFKSLCEEAGKIPAGLVGNALKPIGVKPVLDVLSDATSAMASSLSEWFCGDDGQAPPPFPYSTEPVYPSASNACVANATPEDCDAARKIEKQARPDPHTGECDEEADCSVGGPYDQRVAQARTDCDPTKPNPPKKYVYQERQGIVAYFWTGKGWLRGEPEFKTPTLSESPRAPCVPPPGSGAIGQGYNPVVRKSKDVNDVEPVCSSERAPPGIGAHSGETVSVPFVEVRHILGCQKHEEKTVNLDVSGGQGGTEASGSKSPKRVLAEARLGDEHFQVRTVMRGDASRLPGESLVRLALWGRKPPEDAFSRLAELGKYSYAQAEYFYDGEGGPDAWMWSMSWRARLRRFRLPGEASKNLREACGATCSSFVDQIAELPDVTTH